MKTSYLILTILLFTVTTGIAEAATKTSANSGNWNMGATWVGGVAPGTGDNAIIASGHNVTLNANKTITNFTIDAGGTLTDGGFNLTVSGNLVINGSYNGDGSGRINLTGNGKTIDGTGTINNVNRVDMTAATAKTILATANLTFSGANQRIAIKANNTVTNNGTVTLDQITGSAASSVWTNAANATLNINEDLLSTGTLMANATGNTINYNGSVAQAIKATTYYHLALSNANTKTAGGTLTVNGNFTTSGTATFNGGTSRTHTFLGNWEINSSAVTPFSFTTASTINFNTPGTSAATSLGGTSAAVIGFNNVNLNNTSGFSAGSDFNITGTLTVAAGVTFTPSAAVVINSAATQGTITGNGTVKVTRTASTADYLSQFKFTTQTLTNLTVDYAGTAVQEANALTYGNLTMSNTYAAVAASGDITVNGVLTLNANLSTGDLAMGSNTLTMGASATTAGLGDVTGIVKRTTIIASTEYSFGNQFNTITFPAVGTLPTDLSVRIAIGSAPSWRTGAVQRYYDIMRTGGSGYKATIKMHYKDSELNGNNENNLVFWHRHASDASIMSHGISVSNTTDNWAEQSNWGTFPTSFGSFSAMTLGNSDMLSCTWVGSINSDWSQPDNWDGGIPDINSNVVIPMVGVGYYNPSITSNVSVKTLMIESGGVLRGGTGTQITIAGGNGAWFNEGTFTSETSTIIFTNAGATVSGVTDFYNVTINSGAQLTMSTDNIMRIAGIITNNGTWRARFLANTVEYNGTDQTVINPNGGTGGYHNLILSNSGTKTASENLSIADDLTISGTTTLDGGTSLTHSIGNLIINSSAATPFLYTTSNTINFNAPAIPAATSMSGTSSATIGFNNVNFNNTNGFSSALNFNINGTLTVAAGVTFTPSSAVVINSAAAQGTITGNGTVKVTRTTATADYLSQYNFTTQTLTDLTVNYAGTAAQTASPLTYGNLTMSNTYTAVTAGGDITVNGVLTLNADLSTGDLAMGSNTLSMGASATTAGLGDVTGIVKRTTINASTAYSFGNPFTTITFTSQGTLPTDVSVKISTGSSPSWKTDAINRYYDIIQTGGSGFSVTLQLHYREEELNGNTETNFAFFDIDDYPNTIDHGFSNNNSTDNWVSLANFTNLETSFGTTSGWTIADRSVIRIVWNGANSSSWTDPGNWTGGIPTATDDVDIPNAATTAYDPTFPASTTVNSFTIAAGGIVNGGTGTEFTIEGDSGWRNNGTFNPETSTVIFNGIATIGGTTEFYNVNITSGSLLSTSPGNIMRIAGSLTNVGDFDAITETNNTIEYTGGNQNVDDIGGYSNLILGGNGIKTLPATPISLSGNFTISGTTTVNANATISTEGNFTIGAGASFDAGSFTHYINGNFSNNGTFTASTSNITISGASIQYITSANGTSTNFYDLSIDKSGNNAVLNINTNISNVLSLTNGAFDLNGYTLTINNNATSAIARTNGYIISENTGNSSKLKWNLGSTAGAHIFPFGTTIGTYIPLTFNLTAGTIGNVTISTYPTAANNCPLPVSPVAVTEADNPADVVDRFWQIDKDGASGTADLTFTYTNGEIPENGEDDLVAQRWNGVAWDAPLGSQTANATANTVTIPSISTFSPWTLARRAAPLPIELMSFGVTWNKKILNINWETISEINNDYFTVERSGDGIVFDEFAQIKGAGNSNTLLKYSIPDNDPFSGTSYYRLKQTDFDGRFKYSEVITVKNCIEEINELIIFPNPSNGIFNLCFKGDKKKICSVEIYNLFGEQVYASGSFQSKIDMSNMLRGTYVLYLNLSSEIMVKKIEIEN